MATPHNAANDGDIAKTVLMPGDPLRAQFIAEHFLDNPVCYNTVRGMYGYTGTYRGVPVSVQGSGMGMPSIGIYAYELYHMYHVENILRVGTAGGVAEDVHLRDIVLGQGACTDSNYAAHYHLPGTFAPIASYTLLSAADQAAQNLSIPVRVGNILSTDAFYNEPSPLPQWASMGVLATEMEAAALYMTAAEAGKHALCIVTISDCPLRGESTTADERQTSFQDMMRLALETAVSIS